MFNVLIDLVRPKIQRRYTILSSYNIEGTVINYLAFSVTGNSYKFIICF